jgi:hypothetical protein
MCVKSDPDVCVQSLRQSITDGLSDSQRRQLCVWLTVSSGWVFLLVILGGVTRLTRSGLSMTEWKFTGTLSYAPSAGIAVCIACFLLDNWWCPWPEVQSLFV